MASSSSSLHRRLCDIFTKSQPAKAKRPSRPSSRTPPPPPPPPTPEPPSPQPPPPSSPALKPQQPLEPRTSRKENVRSMFKERDFRTIVNNFKKSSRTSWFRCQHSIYHDTVHRLAAANQFSLIEEILEEQKKYKSITLEGFAVRIMSLYGRSGMFDHAQKLFDEMPQLKCEPTIKSFNTLLTACVHSKRYDKIEEIFRVVPKKLSIEPNVFSYNALVKAYCDMGSMDSAVSVLEEMEGKGLCPDVITCDFILEGFYRNGRFSDAEVFLKGMEDKGIMHGISSYNAKIRGLVCQRRMEEAVEVYQSLGEKGLKPDVSTFNALIQGFCNEKNSEEAKKWYEEMDKNDCVQTKNTLKPLIPLACEMGDVEWGLKLCFAAVRRRWHLETATLQGVLDGLVKESNMESAKELLHLIEETGYYPNGILKLPLAEAEGSEAATL